MHIVIWREKETKKLESASERRFSAKLVPTFAYRGCHVVRVTDPYSPDLGFIDRNLAAKPERRRPLGRRRRWDDNIQLDLTRMNRMAWTDMAVVRHQRRTLLNMTMNLRVS
jgi:hypothetical protein